MSKMLAAEAVVHILEDEGIEVAFGIPGAAINPVYRELSKSHKIYHYISHHEEGACHAERVHHPDEIRPAFQRAVESGKPSVIDIIVDQETDAAMGPALDATREFN